MWRNKNVLTGSVPTPRASSRHRPRRAIAPAGLLFTKLFFYLKI